MSRRAREIDAGLIVARVAGLGLMMAVLASVSPQFRQMFGVLIFVVVCLMIFAAAGALFCWVTKRRRGSSTNTHARPPFLSLPETSPDEIGQSKAELLGKLREIDSHQFEKLVCLIYSKFGYEVTLTGGVKPDGGIDLVLTKNGEQTAVQCKHWKTWDLGMQPMREFLGALTDAGIRNGIFITLSGFSGEARYLAERHGIKVVNDTEFVEMLKSTNVLKDLVSSEVTSKLSKGEPASEFVLR